MRSAPRPKALLAFLLTLVWFASDKSISTVHASEAAFHCGACAACEAGDECDGVDTKPGRPATPHRTMPGDVNRGDCPPARYRMNDCERAGNPHRISRFAKCSLEGNYCAGFVGGGAAFAKVPSFKRSLLSRGRGRESNGDGRHGEGTFGVDYVGLFGRANVWLGYTAHRHQSGEGAYETDGEPDLLARIKHRLHRD